MVAKLDTHKFIFFSGAKHKIYLRGLRDKFGSKDYLEDYLKSKCLDFQSARGQIQASICVMHINFKFITEDGRNDHYYRTNSKKFIYFNWLT